MRRRTKRLIKKVLLNILFFMCVILACMLPILLSHGHKNQKIGQSADMSQIEHESMPSVDLKENVEELKEVVEDVEEKKIEEQKRKEQEGSGKFKLTAYCACSKCCGKWAGGNTASGTKPTQGRTIAVDTSVIPFGTQVIIDGHTYIAEDTGSAIKGNKIDVFFDNHEEALQFGVRYADVTIVR